MWQIWPVGIDGLSRYRQNEEHSDYAVFEKRWYHGNTTRPLWMSFFIYKGGKFK